MSDRSAPHAAAFVERKIAAMAAHRTQYPIEPDMFPMAILREMLGREYFVRIQPPPELEAELLPRPHDESPAAG